MTLTNMLICSGYLVNAVLWVIYFIRFKDVYDFRNGTTLLFFGMSITVVFILMGINRFFNLEIWLGSYLREISKVQGWYEQRHTVQALFIAGIVVSAFGVFALLEMSMPRICRFNWSILVGLILLVGLSMINAASFHNLDGILNGLIAGKSIRSVFELSSLAFITLALIIKFIQTGNDDRLMESAAATRYI